MRPENQVADQLLDPIRELETPEEEQYAVVLKRRDGSGALPPVSFLFHSGEPALNCRDHSPLHQSTRLTPGLTRHVRSRRVTGLTGSDRGEGLTTAGEVRA